MAGKSFAGKSFSLIFLILIVGTSTIEGAEQDEEIADIDWDNLQEIMSLDDAALANALAAQPGLLDNPTVMDALNIKVIAGRIDLINNNPAVIRAWGEDKGITITPNAQIEFYDGATIKTRGLHATTFNPNDVQGAFVLADGSLQLPNQYTVSGSVEKEESGLAIMGEVKDRAGNRLVNEKSHVTLETDGARTIIRSYGETKVYTKDGGFRTISGERSEYLLRFNEKNELVITTLALTTEDLKNPVKVISPKPENNFVLLSGEATIQSVNKVLFEGIQIGAAITPALFEIYGESGEEQPSVFTVTKPTLLCFDECNSGLRELKPKIKPTDYTASTIEVLRPITYNGKPYERNILKITARDNNQMDVHLTNPDQNSIFLDAPGENKITLTQEGKVLQGTEVKPYFSMITATDSTYTFRGKADTELSGSKILILGKDAAFDEQNALVAGKIFTFQPGVVGGIGFIEPEDGFDLLEYHLGKPLPARQKIVGEMIQQEHVVAPQQQEGGIIPLTVDEIPDMSRDELHAHFDANLPRVNSIGDAYAALNQFDEVDRLIDSSTLEGEAFEWTARDTQDAKKELWHRLRDVNGPYTDWTYEELYDVSGIAYSMRTDELRASRIVAPDLDGYQTEFFYKELEMRGLAGPLKGERMPPFQVKTEFGDELCLKVNKLNIQGIDGDSPHMRLLMLLCEP